MAVDYSRVEPIAVLFALRRESQGFRRRFSVIDKCATAPCPAWFCRPSSNSVLVIETGIGAQATQRALDWVLSKPTIHRDRRENGQVGNLTYDPRFLLYAGFAGGLVDDLHVGDVVLATEVRDLDDNRWATTVPSGRVDLPYRRGTILSSPRMIGDPVTKRTLGETHRAIAVDMESAAFARTCAKRGVPFGCMRVISDDVNTRLSPQLVAMLDGGRISWRRVMSALVRRPSLIKQFMRLGRDTRLASERLGQALVGLIGEP